MRGLILSGAYNVFNVKLLPPCDAKSGDGEAGAAGADAGAASEVDAPVFECVIKGKKLKTEGAFYNPLAPGDVVEFKARGAGKGVILCCHARRNVFCRYNIKGGEQIIACNVDLALCVASPLSPPFRPRFIDRVLLQTEIAGIDALLLINKADLLQGAAAHNADAGLSLFNERIADYKRAGYKTLFVSAKSGEGLPELRRVLKNKVSVFTGQSGVGKSSLLNALLPSARRKTAPLNEKFNRGNHATTLAALFEGEDFKVIDTPGVRQFLPSGISAGDLAFYMKEFEAPARTCAFSPSCTHRGEAGCGVLRALERGVIHADRYESYIRLYEELAGRAR